MHTLTLTFHHASLLLVILHTLHRNTPRRMSIAQAASPHHHLVHRVVVLLLEVGPGVEQIVAEGVQLREVDTQIGDLKQVLDVTGVRIPRLDERGRQDPEHNLALSRRRNRGVARLAVEIAQILWQVGGDAGKRLGTVGRKVAVDLPAAAEVGRLLDDHSRGPERLECHDYVREGELGLQIELDVDVLLAVLRLPPAVEAVALLAAHDVLDHVAVGDIPGGVVGLRGVAVVADVLVTRSAQDAVALRATLLEATGGAGV